MMTGTGMSTLHMQKLNPTPISSQSFEQHTHSLTKDKVQACLCQLPISQAELVSKGRGHKPTFLDAMVEWDTREGATKSAHRSGMQSQDLPRRSNNARASGVKLRSAVSNISLCKSAALTCCSSTAGSCSIPAA